MKMIELTQGKQTMVDDADYEWLNQFKWHYGQNGYAKRRKYFKGGGASFIYMHRLITYCPQDKEVDHINHDRLDNRRGNLRIVTRQQNNRNQRISKKNKSGVLGVHYAKHAHKWRAQFKVNGVVKHLGYFDDINKAKEAYVKEETKYWSQWV